MSSIGQGRMMMMVLCASKTDMFCIRISIRNRNCVIEYFQPLLSFHCLASSFSFSSALPFIIQQQQLFTIHQVYSIDLTSL